MACATTYGPLLSGQSLLFYVDNSTDVHMISRQATRSKALAGLLRQLYGIALQYNLAIRATSSRSGQRARRLSQSARATSRQPRRSVGGHLPSCLLLSVLRVPRVQQALRALVDRFAGYSLRLNSRLAYESRQRTFHTICASIRINSAVPLTELQLCGVCIVYAQQHRITSLAGFVSAIAHYAMRMGFPDLPRGRTFDRVRVGLLKTVRHCCHSSPSSKERINQVPPVRPGTERDTAATLLTGVSTNAQTELV